MGKQIDVSALIKPSLMYKVVAIGIGLSVIDLILTLIGLQLGLAEANPFSDFSIPFLAFKLGIWIMFLPLIYFFGRKKLTFGLFVTSLTSILSVCIYTFVVTLNFTLILGVVIL